MPRDLWPSFRYRPDGLLFNSFQANRDIYEGNHNVKKGNFYQMYPRKAGGGNTWNCVDKEARHARKRRILNAAFSDKALKTFEGCIVQHVDRWCELIGADNGWSKPRNMADWSDRLVFDILGELLYARSFNIKEPEDNDMKSIPRTTIDQARFLYYFSQSPLLSVCLWLKPRGLDRFFEIARPKGAQLFLNFRQSCLTSRLKQEIDSQEKQVDTGDVRKDLFHHLFRAKDPLTGGSGYTEQELQEENNLLMVAGSDTTSTVFTAMLSYLTRNPTVHERLASEIRATFSNANDVQSGSKLNSCQYLRAFINEAMRLNPPVTADMNREVLPGGLTVDGHFLQEGTNVGVAPFSPHRNQTVFREPFAFTPKQWIPDEKTGITAASVVVCESAFRPFSIGSRGCPGKQLAYLEMSITMAKVLFLYDVRAVEGDDLGAGRSELMWGRRNTENYQTWDVFVSTRDGPQVQFKSRRT
ncbi:MAG: hypothetical protein LQ343_001290 [Gyalolechia ehrenbergii]|nr:MAG: hypothetical protein LQ343_001290 [Gyalolechia ehrenbergii]